jgi:hypothetical protein
MVSTDDGHEFRSQEFSSVVLRDGARHRFIHAGPEQPLRGKSAAHRPGAVLTVHLRPLLVPKYTAQRRYLIRYRRFYTL